LYRLKRADELEYLGFGDYCHDDALCLVEWPDKGGALLPSPDLTVSLRADGAGRRLQLHAQSAWGQSVQDAFFLDAKPIQ